MITDKLINQQLILTRLKNNLCSELVFNRSEMLAFYMKQSRGKRIQKGPEDFDVKFYRFLQKMSLFHIIVSRKEGTQRNVVFH